MIARFRGRATRADFSGFWSDCDVWARATGTIKVGIRKRVTVQRDRAQASLVSLLDEISLSGHS